MKKKIKKKFIEMNVIDWGKVFLYLINYPIILFAGFVVFFFNFIRYNLKLLCYLMVSLIPIVNSSLVPDSGINLRCLFDEFKFTMDNLKSIKRFEVIESK